MAVARRSIEKDTAQPGLAWRDRLALSKGEAAAALEPDALSYTTSRDLTALGGTVCG